MNEIWRKKLYIELVLKKFEIHGYSCPAFIVMKQHNNNNNNMADRMSVSVQWY